LVPQNILERCATILAPLCAFYSICNEIASTYGINWLQITVDHAGGNDKNLWRKKDDNTPSRNPWMSFWVYKNGRRKKTFRKTTKLYRPLVSSLTRLYSESFTSFPLEKTQPSTRDRTARTRPFQRWHLFVWTSNIPNFNNF